MTIKKVAVIGAGTMGSGIAGQVANAGVEVWLLDLPSKGNENAFADRGMQRLRETNGLLSADCEAKIHLGNTRDDFHQLADCDWIVEAVVERLDIKQELYQRISEFCRDDALISSNSSNISIKVLVEKMPIEYRRRFAITHFFNPVRFMPLLELVSGEDTSADVIEELANFCDLKLGKGVVICRDTPGFLGNRVGCYAIQCALQAAYDLGLSPIEADAIFGRPMGIPKTGVFGLYDLFGIDLMSDVAHSLVNNLPNSDDFHREAEKIPLVVRMIENGQTGNKKGQGFYRSRNGVREVIDLKTGNYISVPKLDLPVVQQAQREGINALLKDDSKYGRFAWRVLSRTLSYAASIIPEVGDDPVDVDDAMKLGYNWVKGPFELLDEIGVDDFIARLDVDGLSAPAFLEQAAGSSFYRVKGGALQVRRYQTTSAQPEWHDLQRPAGVMRFNEKRRTLNPVNSCEVASWFDLDEVAIVEFHSKENALDSASIAILADAIDQVKEQKLRGMIIHNDTQHFSCGVDLKTVRRLFEQDDYEGLDAFLENFQSTLHALATAEFPVVCAPVGMALGGGFEVVLHSKQVICHANSTMGLVESGLGLIPAGGGCKETLYRWREQLGVENHVDAAWKAFMSLGYGQTCTSPLLAQQQAMLRDNDRFLSNRDRILPAAIAALDSLEQQSAFDRPAIAVAGKPEFEKMKEWLREAKSSGKLTPHNVVVATELARIVTGGDVETGTELTEQDFYDAERAAFLKLVATPATRERITSMLETGKTVHN